VDKLPQLEWIIGIDNQRCLTSVSQQSLTHATTDLGNWLNGKLVLYLGDLANPKIGLNLVPNPL
jgi:hypothetical protein